LKKNSVKRLDEEIDRAQSDYKKTKDKLRTIESLITKLFRKRYPVNENSTRH